MKTATLFCVLLLCISLGAGCGAARPSKYYQLTVPIDAAPPTGSAPYHVTLMLGPITSSHLYREDHIVYTGSGQDMGVYQYQRWAQPPTEMIGEVLLRDLRASARFQAVPGIGKRTAERIIVELREKVGAALGDGIVVRRAAAEDAPRELARQGLAELGFTPLEGDRLLADAAGETAEELLASALRARRLGAERR